MAIERENNGKLAMLEGAREHAAGRFEAAAGRFAVAAENFDAAAKKQIALLNQGASLIGANKPDEAIVALEAARNAGLQSDELTRNFEIARHNLDLKLYNVANNIDGYQKVIARDDIDPKLKLNTYCKLAELQLGAEGELDALIAAKEFYDRLADKAPHQNAANFIFTHLTALYLCQHNNAQLLEVLNEVEQDMKVAIVKQLKDLALYENTVEGHTAQAMHMMATLSKVLQGEGKAEVNSDLADIALSQNVEKFTAFAETVLSGAEIVHEAIDGLFA